MENNEEQASAISVAALPRGERPRERLARHGSDALTTPELLAILLGSGVTGAGVLQLAQQLLARFASLEALSQATVAELCQQRGIGPAKALQLKAALGLAQRMERSIVQPQTSIHNPQQAFHYLKGLFVELRQECFVVLMQDVHNKVLRHDVVALGSMEEVAVHPREVFYPAIRHKATSVLIAHNHPSGEVTPSKEDIRLTERLWQAGKLLSIDVVDHLIVANDRYLSLRQQRLGPYNT